MNSNPKFKITTNEKWKRGERMWNNQFVFPFVLSVCYLVHLSCAFIGLDVDGVSKDENEMGMMRWVRLRIMQFFEIIITQEREWEHM